eukprot:CAMPEP_0177641970 /NCGR_PEP_ID=MMETSP0447-20121125/7343_1 /TAXON_ID=0 /ORGANISM="Stygamoeba regulata, Strain BSH-02190019" /LENGTH=984 /DNA_ID=CAMNT_0019144109 /DNA_START=147 /DNA_END=3101 /DNA_ORIENTATION=+
MSSLYLPGAHLDADEDSLYAPPTHLYASFANLSDLDVGDEDDAKLKTKHGDHPPRTTLLLGNHRGESGAHLYTIPAETRERIDKAYRGLGGVSADSNDAYGDAGLSLTTQAEDEQDEGAYADEGEIMPPVAPAPKHPSSESSQPAAPPMPPLPTVLSRSYSAIFAEEDDEEQIPGDGTIRRKPKQSVFERGRGYGHAAHLLENAYTTPISGSSESPRLVHKEQTPESSVQLDLGLDASNYADSTGDLPLSPSPKAGLSREEQKMRHRRSTLHFEGTDDEGSDDNEHAISAASPASLDALKARARANSSAWTMHNWNSEFQEVMTFGHLLYCDSQPGTVRLARYGRLSEISRNFTHAAETYAKIIISELCLPPEQKSIRPSEAGGIAGGLKYVVQGIFFKFVVDTKLRSNPDYWMYGGSEGPNDEAAVKAAGNELVGAIAVWSQYVDDLHSPMMSIIDYQGFRVLAISVLPLSKDTLAYGSNDGGKTVHRDHEKLAELIEKVTEKLGLAKHRVGKSSVEIGGPGDLEGHVGLDGKLYVLDLGRLLPPEAPSSLATERERRSVFYRLLRPELLYRYGKPLCSDAFTGWDDGDPAIALKHAQEVRDATNYLMNNIIPAVAKHLDRVGEAAYIYDKKNPDDMLDKWASVGSEKLHSFGLNCRHMGRLRSHVTLKSLRSLLLHICVARTLKNLMAIEMRAMMKLNNIPTETPFKRLFVKFWNTLLLDDSIVNPKSKIFFWTQDIKREVETRFPECLSKEETSVEYNLHDALDMKFLLVLLAKLLHIRLHQKALEDILEHDEFSLIETDVLHMECGIKKQTIVDFCDAGTLSITASLVTSEVEKRRLYAAASRAYDNVRRRLPHCPVAQDNYATAVFNHALLENRLKIRQKLLNRCNRVYEELVRSRHPWLRTSVFDNYAVVLEENAKLAERQKDMECAIACREKLVKLAQAKTDWENQPPPAPGVHFLIDDFDMPSARACALSQQFDSR